MSRIFNCILNKVCRQIVSEPFKANQVSDCLGSSIPFLSKHAIDPLNPNKIIYGRPYFIRVGTGKYIINPKYKTCP